MFGLENQKKKNDKPKEFNFELEEELNNKGTQRKQKEHVENQIQKIKQILRSGENKEEFDRFGVLLHGYTSLQKVISRFNQK